MAGVQGPLMGHGSSGVYTLYHAISVYFGAFFFANLLFILQQLAY